MPRKKVITDLTEKRVKDCSKCFAFNWIIFERESKCRLGYHLISNKGRSSISMSSNVKPKEGRCYNPVSFDEYKMAKDERMKVVELPNVREEKKKEKPKRKYNKKTKAKDGKPNSKPKETKKLAKPGSQAGSLKRKPPSVKKKRGGS